MVMSGCSLSTPMDVGDGIFQKLEVGDSFTHRVLVKPGSGEILHIYIEGDGLAWLSRTRVSSDPSPKNPLMFSLMKLDSAPAVYIGRPCYFMQGNELDIEYPECSPYWWTFGRYSEKVLSSMAVVVAKESENYKQIVLIGHSGGGTLATLLAKRNDKIKAVVTAAANLNLSEWAAHHQYTYLYGSLDPTLFLVLPNDIVQLHYLGDADSEIKEGWQKKYLARHPNASLIILPGVTHQQGWDTHWPAILRDLSSQL